MPAKATPDYTKVMKDMLGAFPVDTSAAQEVFKNQAAFADKMSKVVLDAAEQVGASAVTIFSSANLFAGAGVSQDQRQMINTVQPAMLFDNFRANSQYCRSVRNIGLPISDSLR